MTLSFYAFLTSPIMETIFLKGEKKMTEKKFRKFASNLDSSKFRELAEAAVDFDCRNFDGTKITGTARDNIIEVMSLDYQTGSNFTKTKYFTVGCISGVIAVVSFLRIKKSIKTKKEES